MFGSQYHVRQSFEETMRARGYGPNGRNLRRRIVPSTDADRQRAAATRRAGYRPGSVVWPNE